MDFESIAPPYYATRACSEEGSEVRTRAEVAFVLDLLRAGWNDCDRSRDRDRTKDRPGLAKRSHPGLRPHANAIKFRCAELRRLQGRPTEPAAGLLHLPSRSLPWRRVHRCSPAKRLPPAHRLCRRLPELIQLCETAMAEVLPNKVSRVRKEGCTEVTASSKHWPCLFPQHGPGRKHERKIELTPW
jgi:hypothetical protein